MEKIKIEVGTEIKKRKNLRSVAEFNIFASSALNKNDLKHKFKITEKVFQNVKQNNVSNEIIEIFNSFTYHRQIDSIYDPIIFQLNEDQYQKQQNNFLIVNA